MFSLKTRAPRNDPAPPAPTRSKDNRYDPAIKQFGDINSEARVQRKNAMIFAAGCLIVAAIEAYGQAVASSQPKQVPYVIRIDERGRVVNVGAPPRLDQDPTTVQIAVMYQLRQFIECVRFVTYDPGFQTQQIKEHVRPYLSTNTEATTLVNDYYKQNDPYAIAHNGTTIEVNVKSIVPEDSTTFAMDWIETTKLPSGVVTNTSEWNGFATVQLGQISTDPAARNLNPLGMYIRNLTWENITLRPASPKP